MHTALSNESADTLVGVVRVLGPKPPPAVLEAMASALLNGPIDLVCELHLAGGTGAASHDSRQRLVALVEDRGGEPFAALDLIDAFSRHVMLSRRFDTHARRSPPS